MSFLMLKNKHFPKYRVKLLILEISKPYSFKMCMQVSKLGFFSSLGCWVIFTLCPLIPNDGCFQLGKGTT